MVAKVELPCTNDAAEDVGAVPDVEPTLPEAGGAEPEAREVEPDSKGAEPGATLVAEL